MSDMKDKQVQDHSELITTVNDLEKKIESTREKDIQTANKFSEDLKQEIDKSFDKKLAQVLAQSNQPPVDITDYKKPKPQYDPALVELDMEAEGGSSDEEAGESSEYSGDEPEYEAGEDIYA